MYCVLGLELSALHNASLCKSPEQHYKVDSIVTRRKEGKWLSNVVTRRRARTLTQASGSGVSGLPVSVSPGN